MGANGKNVFVFGVIFMLLFAAAGVSSAPIINSPARIVNGVFSNTLSAIMKWIWSLKASTKTAMSARPLMKFEPGYTVETMFDGSKAGIDPHSVEVLPSGELLIVDSTNSNLYKIPSSMSLYTKPKLVAGSAEGYSGYVDGKPGEAKMNHPKGVAVDDRGNIYVADTMNNAIRKISDSGVTTIAGGKRINGGSHVDGASEDAKFSNDFDVVYMGSSCSLLVIDRGNRAIREIQLHFDDCAYQYGSGFPFEIVLLLAAGLFGYMVAFLQRRMGTIVSSQGDQGVMKSSMAETPAAPQPLKSVRPPLIPTEDDQEKQEETLFASLGKLFANAGASFMEIVGGIAPGFMKKSVTYHQYQNQQQQQRHSAGWPSQDSFVIPDEDEPPTVEARTPTPRRKTYAFMSKDAEKMNRWRQGRSFYGSQDGEMPQQQHQQQQQQQQPHPQQHQHQQHTYQHPHQQHSSQPQPQPQPQKQPKQHRHHRYQSTTPGAPYTYYEQSHEKTNEIVFGAVQERDVKHEASVIKPVDYADPMYNHHSIRVRSTSTYGNNAY
ncbi:unnamed protein product [Linum tenue]|uniref:NHL repeat-containing protein n=1 Tax=Linum tenue TaxID=586396 RepID=A0AAV0S2X0_9ROSI|nr:unnamed protein product [Linum tenue]